MSDQRPLLLAPDSFKGTLSAVEVADALARGIEAAGGMVDRCPAADGGEGTLDALRQPLGLTVHKAEVHDPLGRAITAAFGLADDGVAVVEVTAASGLHLVAETDRDAVAASSEGTGELIAAAAAAGARHVLVAAGGSATSDGGAGAIRALRHVRRRLPKLTVLCDVRTPFEAAARVFGPQKGASPEQVTRLTRRLQTQARRLLRDPRDRPFTGAAGGLSGGLWSAFGAELVAGAPYVLETAGFSARLRTARAVITGEGCLDNSSLAGKVVSEVATQARQTGVPCHAVVGRSALDRFGRRILDLDSVTEAGTPEEIERAGEIVREQMIRDATIVARLQG
jgi:glycerate kinase